MKDAEVFSSRFRHRPACGSSAQVSLTVDA
jgi:hypothetical protein